MRTVLKEDAPQIVRRVLTRWDEIINREPWWSMDHVDADHLEALVRAVADAALRSRCSGEVARHFVDTAMRHGRDRRADGHRDSVVHQEFLLLRRALRDDLKEEFGTSAATHRVLTRLETALGHAEIASLHGYHELELPRESVERAPERLAAEWARIMDDWPVAA
ncbi:MAG: hypothetical protein ACLFRX_07685 [Gemmatimonadota bacterium]